MITAVDSSVLWAIAKGEADGAAWLETLAKCRVEGRLVVCDIVWAETRVGFPTATAQAGFFERMGVHFDLSDAAVCDTGRRNP